MDDFISVIINIFIVIGIVRFIANRFKKKGDKEDTNEQSTKKSSGFNFSDFEKFASQISNNAEANKETFKRAEDINDQAEDKFPPRVNAAKQTPKMSAKRTEKEFATPNIHNIAQPNISDYELDVKKPHHEGFASPQYSKEGYASRTEGSRSAYEGMNVSIEGYQSRFDTENLRPEYLDKNRDNKMQVLPEFNSQSLVQAFVMSEIINKPKFLSKRGR